MSFWLDYWTETQKEECMLQAVSLALKGKGQTAPNPCVGALLVQDGTVLARGWHQGYGLPHAEVEALQNAAQKGFESQKSALFVTLEPCNHQGQTPPCTEAIIKSGIKHVLVGCRDPNPDVRGKGIECLRSHGVQVQTGIAWQACQDLVQDFKVWRNLQRPYVFLKLASTLDGKIADREGQSAWVSGRQSRARVHEMRRQVQAVLVGKNTFFADDPRLDCRQESHFVQRQPLAVVVSSQLPAPDSMYSLLTARAEQTLFWTSKTAAQSRQAWELQKLGICIWALDNDVDGLLDLSSGFRRLFSELGCYYVLCEGGGRLGMYLMQHRLIDEFHLVLAPKVLGDEQAIAVLCGDEVRTMQQGWAWRFTGQEYLDPDLWLTLKPFVLPVDSDPERAE